MLDYLKNKSILNAFLKIIKIMKSFSDSGHKSFKIQTIFNIVRKNIKSLQLNKNLKNQFINIG